MSFGVVQSAITAIKNNKGLMSHRDKLKNTLSGKSRSKLEFEHSATKEDLKQIRLRLQSEHKQKRLKIIIVFGVLMVAVLTLFIYFL